MRVMVPIVVVLASTFIGSGLAAQTPRPPVPSPSPSPSAAAPEEANDPDPDSADLSITATVSYGELKFDQVGTPKVEFSGQVVAPELGPDAKLHTVWHADRGGLPRPVQPGVVYRDGTVRLTITTRFEDLARLFAEDAPAAQPTPQPAPSPSPVPR